jgi:hypothetical protein
VVLTDTEGNYYVLSQQMIESAKVTDPQQKAELQKSAQGDTAGFVTFGAVSPFALGGAQYQLLGRCSCNFQFNPATGVLQR